MIEFQNEMAISILLSTVFVFILVICSLRKDKEHRHEDIINCEEVSM